MPVGDHAITFDEFQTIYNIFKKYEGLTVLKMNEQEQKEFDEYLRKIEEEPHPINQFIYLPEDFEEYKQKVRECLIIIHKYSPERADELMQIYKDDFEEAFYVFRWKINEMTGAMIFGY